MCMVLHFMHGSDTSGLSYTLWLVLPRSWHSGTYGCVLQQDHQMCLESHCKQDVVGLQAAHWTLLAQTAEAQQNSIHRPLLQQKAAAGASQSEMWSVVIGLSRGERTTSSFKSRSVPWTCLRRQKAGRDLG